MRLSDAMLARMRADVARTLPDVAVIQAVTRTDDGGGGWSESWAAVTGGTVAARLDPLGKMAAIDTLALQETLTARYQLTVPYDAPLAQDRQVVIDGNTYQAIQMDVDHSWNVSKRALVAEVR